MYVQFLQRATTQDAFIESHWHFLTSAVITVGFGAEAHRNLRPNWAHCVRDDNSSELRTKRPETGKPSSRIFWIADAVAVL